MKQPPNELAVITAAILIFAACRETIWPWLVQNNFVSPLLWVCGSFLGITVVATIVVLVVTRRRGEKQ